MLLFLALTLVFSLTLGTAAFALDANSYGIPEEEIERGVKWEELNALVCEINERFLGENVTGNYFTDNYTNALRNARDYAQYLLDTPASAYGELSDMTDSLRYLISESGNPANHELACHYTVAFTDTQGWGDTVYVYAWNTKGFYEFEWPGIGVRSSYVNEFGQKQFYAYIGEEYDYVIFSSSSGAQTTDIPLYDKTGYYPTGEVDAKGSYKVNSWHIGNPRYPEYIVPADPTEPPSTVPTESDATASADPYGDIPHFSPDNPSEDYIDYYLPKYDTAVKLTLRNYDSELYEELYDLIIFTDSTIGAPGNNYPDDYRERVMRVRNFSATVYNHDRMEDHELTGAIRALKMALDGESSGRIVDCLRYYFIYADDEPTQATESSEPTEPNYRPGEVLVMLHLGSASTISDLLSDFETEEIYLLTPGSDQKCYQVKFKEKSTEIVWRAIEVLSASPSVKSAEPNYLGHYEVLYLRGDADGDGDISVLDATKIQKVLASVEADVTGLVNRCGDVNGDGLDILDATAIQKYLAGIAVPYPINELFS